MSGPQHPVTDAFDYEGCVTAGRATGKPIPLPSDEDLRRAEEAWNNPAFYELWKDEPLVGAGWVPKSTVDLDLPLFPSAGEIEKLPRWARVAFAARCARRVLPLVKRFWTGAPLIHLKAFDSAVATAESADIIPVAKATIVQEAASSAAEEVGTAFAFHVAHAAAYAAARAARNASAAATHAIAGTKSGATYDIDAASAATEGMFLAARVGTINSLVAPARDFDLLSRLVKKEKWTDDTPVPPTVFGPMWDGPPPEWWTDNILTDLPNESTAETEEHDESTFPLK